MKQKKKTSFWPFVGVFGIIIVWMTFTNLTSRKITTLPVQDNKGVSFLQTIGESLVCVFQDGRACVWDWRQLPDQKEDFKLGTDRVILLNDKQLAAVNLQGPKIFAVYDLPSNKKTMDVKVGYEDQNCRLRISPDRSVTCIVRQNPADSTGSTLYEFLTVDIAEKLTGLPVSRVIGQNRKWVDFAVDTRQNVYAVGSIDEQGRMTALNMDTGKTIWDRSYEDAKEFCSVIVSPDNGYILAGNRDGILYKLDVQSGDIIKKIQLLEEGETRPITNDYSVLNLAFSPDGQYYVATINPPAYILKTESDKVIYKFVPANKLVSRITFSPDNQFVATSDIRAGYPIKIFSLPKEE